MVKTWTKSFDPYKKELILIPMNWWNTHWTLAAIFVKLNYIVHYDSCVTVESGVDEEAVKKCLILWLKEEAKGRTLEERKKNGTLNTNVQLQETRGAIANSIDWKFIGSKESEAHKDLNQKINGYVQTSLSNMVPQQRKRSNDCALFVTYFMDFLFHKIPIPEVAQLNMDNIRLKYAYHFLRNDSKTFLHPRRQTSNSGLQANTVTGISKRQESPVQVQASSVPSIVTPSNESNWSHDNVIMINPFRSIEEANPEIADRSKIEVTFMRIISSVDNLPSTTRTLLVDNTTELSKVLTDQNIKSTIAKTIFSEEIVKTPKPIFMLTMGQKQVIFEKPIESASLKSLGIKNSVVLVYVVKTETNQKEDNLVRLWHKLLQYIPQPYIYAYPNSNCALVVLLNHPFYHHKENEANSNEQTKTIPETNIKTNIWILSEDDGSWYKLSKVLNLDEVKLKTTIDNLRVDAKTKLQTFYNKEILLDADCTYMQNDVKQFVRVAGQLTLGNCRVTTSTSLNILYLPRGSMISNPHELMRLNMLMNKAAEEADSIKSNEYFRFPRSGITMNTTDWLTLMSTVTTDNHEKENGSEEGNEGHLSSDGNHLYNQDGVINVDRNTFSSEAPREYPPPPKHTIMITGVLKHFGLSN